LGFNSEQSKIFLIASQRGVEGLSTRPRPLEKVILLVPHSDAKGMDKVLTHPPPMGLRDCLYMQT